jgi:hypothetical protein
MEMLDRGLLNLADKILDALGDFNREDFDQRDGLPQLARPPVSSLLR